MGAHRSIRHRVDGVVCWREDRKGIIGKADEGNVMEGLEQDHEMCENFSLGNGKSLRTLEPGYHGLLF